MESKRKKKKKERQSTSPGGLKDQKEKKKVGISDKDIREREEEIIIQEIPQNKEI